MCYEANIITNYYRIWRKDKYRVKGIVLILHKKYHYFDNLFKYNETVLYSPSVFIIRNKLYFIKIFFCVI